MARRRTRVRPTLIAARWASDAAKSPSTGKSANAAISTATAATAASEMSPVRSSTWKTGRGAKLRRIGEARGDREGRVARKDCAEMLGEDELCQRRGDKRETERRWRKHEKHHRDVPRNLLACACRALPMKIGDKPRKQHRIAHRGRDGERAECEVEGERISAGFRERNAVRKVSAIDDRDKEIATLGHHHRRRVAGKAHRQGGACKRGESLFVLEPHRAVKDRRKDGDGERKTGGDEGGAKERDRDRKAEGEKAARPDHDRVAARVKSRAAQGRPIFEGGVRRGDREAPRAMPGAGSGKAPDKVAMIASASANPVDAQNATSSVARNAGSRVRASGV